MKQVKVGMFVQVLRDVDLKLDPPGDTVSMYDHMRVTEVTDQDTIKVKFRDGNELVALRLGEPPNWRVNRFGIGG